MSEQENQDSDQEDQNFLMDIENGHITASNSGAEESNSSSDDEPIVDANGRYNLDLPPSHGYLGKLNTLRGYTLFEDGEVLKNIFAIYTNTLVFPGFVLPLVMNNYYENRILQNFLEDHNKVFILISTNSSGNMYEYGVTMEIYEMCLINNLMHVKARGGQRCKRVSGSSVESLSSRIKLVTVKILAEKEIIPPLADTQLLALKSKRKWTVNNFDEDIKLCTKYRRWHAAQFSQPLWVYDMNEVSYYTKTLIKGLISYGEELIPKDPEKLSYWFVQNYHLNHRERLHILSLTSTLERLKLEVMYMKLARSICCENCNVDISDPSHMFAMSKEGMRSNFVNPRGHVYETVTVKEAKNYRTYGHPSRQFSWFPGYSWTIMQCVSCNNHLGWRFTNPCLIPKEFYGLANTGIKTVTKKLELDVENSQEGKISFAHDYVGLQL
ncbi:hypothetical protein ABEB36_006600 [Hypothenemus hampei]|uniref:Protein cereblon n=1 Tax=Hypothenemus hampei TaxID=57062 RepID=A0ABD1ETC2_HYPHA